MPYPGSAGLPRVVDHVLVILLDIFPLYIVPNGELNKAPATRYVLS